MSLVRFTALFVLACSLTHPAALSAAEEDGRKYSQPPKVAESVARAAEPATTKPATVSPPAGRERLSAGPTPQWIWGADTSKRYFLKTEFAGGSKHAWLKATCDNAMTVWLNDQRVATSSEWQSPVEVDVQNYVLPGNNVLLVKVENEGGAAGFVSKLALVQEDGKAKYIVSDSSWQVATGKNAETWDAARVVGKHGVGPWNDVLNRPASAVAAAPRNVFEVPPGFQVERLFTVPKEQLGSWVCLTTDPKGRLLVCDQGKEGLCRITPPPIGSTEPTKVERLDLKITSAQGMLCAFDSLYLSVNGGPGSGLYRARDTNGDDQYDELTKLKEFRGGGEHGPHALRLSPDGKSLCVIAGNHTRPPFEVSFSGPPQTFGGSRAEPLMATLPAGASSRLRPNWDEDLLLPRQWDANGHAAGILAPGGWVAMTDPDGKTWEVITSGYRNPYDMAFNADGELFVYDADMEWDMGMPWYRPTRVSHATSGSEFGWRSGTGKWPAYYVDSLPELVDIGPGSPVGVEFGYGTRFPARYQRALYILDWTFGTIYSIHIEPAGASYKATKEEFVSRTPLPLTDATVGHDGALYFTVGGRGTQSELFRVTYVGDEPTTPVDAHNEQFAELRKLRRQIEAYHRPLDVQDGKLTTSIAFLLSHLKHEDRHIRYAARVALEHQDRAHWQDVVLAEANPDARLAGVVALARTGDQKVTPSLIAALERLDFGELSPSQQLDWLRAASLVFIRLGEPDKDTMARLVAKLDKSYPAQSDALNRELCTVLVYLNSPTVASKSLALLKQPTQHTTQQMSELLARNPGYAGAISAMLANQPETQKLAYAFSLRNLREGWTTQERVAYFQWLNDQRQKKGGNSFQGFLKNMEKDAYENASDTHRLAIESAGLRQPYKPPELPKAKGPGKEYTLSELLALSSTHLKGRSFENGKKMFSAARCVVCHRFQGDGGATGPDLTQAAGRFNVKDLSEAIVDPSKVVSDQYRTTIVQTSAGKTYTGRVLSFTDTSISMLIDPEDSTKIVEIKKSDIEEQVHSPLSLMPKDLLKTLNQDEVLDLLAYLLARGNPQDALFRK